MSGYAIRNAHAGDDAGILNLVGAPQPSTGLTLGFERAPSYFLSASVSHQSPDILVATHRGSDSVAGLVNVGERQVYVNGEPRNVRFGGDMRISPRHQGGRLLLYFSRAIRERLGDSGWYQTVILKENARSRATFDQGGRAGMPLYFPQQSVVTYTLTSAPEASANNCRVRVATAGDVPAMNEFVRKMAAHYQFLPAYDFAGVLRGDDYFRGLAIEDFLLVERDGAICALGGLWQQKPFKQTRVMAYRPLLAILRPLYNLWVRWRGGLLLPPPGELLDYTMVHSPLSAPHDLQAFEQLLQALWRRLTVRGGRALCLSLADNDPRRAVLRGFRHYAITGTHYLATYNPACLPELDTSRIAYFECGRL